MCRAATVSILPVHAWCRSCAETEPARAMQDAGNAVVTIDQAIDALYDSMDDGDNLEGEETSGLSDVDQMGIDTCLFLDSIIFKVVLLAYAFICVSFYTHCITFIALK